MEEKRGNGSRIFGEFVNCCCILVSELLVIYNIRRGRGRERESVEGEGEEYLISKLCSMTNLPHLVGDG